MWIIFKHCINIYKYIYYNYNILQHKIFLLLFLINLIYIYNFSLLINITEALDNIRMALVLESSTKMMALSGAAGNSKNRPYYLITIPSLLPLSRLRERRDYEAACAHPGIRSDKNISFDRWRRHPSTIFALFPSWRRACGNQILRYI